MSSRNLLTKIFGVFGSLLNWISESKNSDAIRRRDGKRRLLIESLESRELLSATPFSPSFDDWDDDNPNPPAIVLPLADVFSVDYEGLLLPNATNSTSANDFIGGDGTNSPDMDEFQEAQLGDSLNNDGSSLSLTSTGLIGYVAAEGFVGTDAFLYDIEDTDDDLTLGSSFIVIEVLPQNAGNGNEVDFDDLDANFNIDENSSLFGQISINGNNSQISTSERFNPFTNSTFTATLDQIEREVERTFGNITGTSVERLSFDITSDFFSNGDWFYSEQSSFYYCLTADDNTFWGGYTYSLFAGEINGVYHHTFVLNTFDYYFITENIVEDTDGQPSREITTKLIGGTVATTFISYVDNSIQISATEILSTNSASQSLGKGTYQYAVADGDIIDGNLRNENSKIDHSFQKISNITENNTTTTTGNLEIFTKEITNNNYEAEGEYATTGERDSNGDYIDTLGTITENGTSEVTSTYTIFGTLETNGEWTNTGTAVLTSESYSYFFNEHTITLQETGSDDNNDWTDSATKYTSIETAQNSEQTVGLSLTDGTTWETTSGDGFSEDTTTNILDYALLTIYNQSGDEGGRTWNNNGTITRDEYSYDNSFNRVDSIWEDDDWAYSGEGYGSGCSCTNYTLAETGTYTTTYTQGDITFTLANGETSRNITEQSCTSFTTDSTYDGNIWTTTGSGNVSGTSHFDSSYSCNVDEDGNNVGGDVDDNVANNDCDCDCADGCVGDGSDVDDNADGDVGDGDVGDGVEDNVEDDDEGTFAMTINDARIVGNNILSGEVKESGKEKSDSNWSNEIELQDGVWVMTNGNGTTTSNGESSFEYSGEVTTTEEYTDGNTNYSHDSNRSIEGKETTSWNTTEHSEIVNGQWSTTSGEGENNGYSFLETSIESDGGEYETTVTDTAAVDKGQQINGTIYFKEYNKDETTTSLTLAWDSTAQDWTSSGTIHYDSEAESKFDKVSTSGSFWDNIPETTTSTNTVLPDGSTYPTTRTTSRDFSGTIEEEFHTESSFDADYIVNVNSDETTTLASGTITNSWHEDSYTILNGHGESNESVSVTDQNGNELVSNTVTGTNDIEDKKTAVLYDETQEEEVVDGEWKIKSGNYNHTTSETGTTRQTVTLRNENKTTGSTIVHGEETTDEETLDIVIVYAGEVVETTVDDVTSKDWQESAIATDNSSGKNSKEETLESSPYTRAITGGTITGTIEKSNTEEYKYGNNNVKSKLINDEWKVVSGSKWTETAITESEECSGSGTYTTTTNGVTLSGTVTESWLYETTSLNARITDTFNATTDEWEKSTGKGSITRKETKTFSDKGTGSYTTNGITGTINKRDIEEEYYYTATYYLGSDKTEYTQRVKTSSDYDATESSTTDTNAGVTLTGTREQWTKEKIDADETITWVVDTNNNVTIKSGKFTSKSSFDSGVSFTMSSNGYGTSDFDSYSYETSTKIDGDVTETLNVSGLNEFISAATAPVNVSTLSLDGYWTKTGGQIEAVDKYKLDWESSGTNENVSQIINNQTLTGDTDWTETYSVDRELKITEVFADSNDNGNSTDQEQTTGDYIGQVIDDFARMFLGDIDGQITVETTNQSTGQTESKTIGEVIGQLVDQFLNQFLGQSSGNNNGNNGNNNGEIDDQLIGQISDQFSEQLTTQYGDQFNNLFGDSSSLLVELALGSFGSQLTNQFANQNENESDDNENENGNNNGNQNGNENNNENSDNNTGTDSDDQAVVAGITGSGTETIEHYRSDSFTAYDQSYAYHDSTGLQTGNLETSLQKTQNFDYELVDKENNANGSNTNTTSTNNAESLDDKEWQITGTGSTISNTTWNFSDNAEGSYTSGAQTFNVAHTETVSYTEEDLTIEQSYDQTNGWTPTSIDGTGTFDYHVNDKTEMSESRVETLFDGAFEFNSDLWTTVETDKTDVQEIGYQLVDGEIIREVTSGTIVETSKSSSGYLRDGLLSESEITTSSVADSCDSSDPSDPSDCTDCECGCVNAAGYAYYFFEQFATHEEYSTSYEEVVTTTWSNTVDNSGELVYSADVSAVLTTTTSGGYSFDHDFVSTSDFYNYIVGGGDDISYAHMHSGTTSSMHAEEEYSSELTETWTKSDGENSFSLSSRTGSYEDSYEADYDYEYIYRELLTPSGVTYDYNNATSSTYDSYEVTSDNVSSNDSFDDEFEKDWTENDVEIEPNDYLSAAMSEISQAQNEYTGENDNDYEIAEHGVMYGTLLNYFGSVPFFITNTSIPTSFTDNGSNDNYSYAAPTPYDIPPTNNGTLGEPHPDTINYNDLTTGSPDIAKRADTMPEVAVEKPVAPVVNSGETPGVSDNTWYNAFCEAWGDSTEANRIAGVAQVAGGMAQAIIGVTFAMGGLAGAPATAGFSIIATAGGSVMALNALDNIQAGIRQTISGVPVQTLTSSAVESVTGSHLAGESVDFAIGFFSPSVAVKVAQGGAAVKAITSAADDIADASKSLFRSCFLAGTLVAKYSPDSVSERELVPIEEIKFGDQVWAFNLSTMKWEPKHVLETFRTEYEGDIVALNIGDEKIDATGGHPFFVTSGEELENRPVCDCLPESDQGMTQNGRWVYARDLRVGDVVISRSLSKQQITAVESSITETLVYNFLVDDLHNYAVGNDEILVHNTNAPKKSDTQIYEELPDNISVKARRTPKNDAEKIAMERIKADPLLGEVVKIKLTDPHFSQGTWRKMEYKEGTVVIHYVREIFTGVVKDFKFKD